MRKGLRYDEMSMEETVYVAKLIASFITDSLTLEEINELRQWIEESNVHREIFRFFTDPSFMLRIKQAQWN